jgi:hypothetical protein
MDALPLTVILLGVAVLSLLLMHDVDRVLHPDDERRSRRRDGAHDEGASSGDDRVE